MFFAPPICLLSESHPLEGGRTVLLQVQEGDIWRVQIVWPNGRVHYFWGFIGVFGERE
jgi:hypothetical protein